MDQSRKILIVIIVLIIAIPLLAFLVKDIPFISSFISNISPASVGSGTLSPDILYITNPVYTFFGNIEKADSNSITVSQTASTNQALDPATPGKSAPTKKLTYKVKITGATVIMPIIPPATGSAMLIPAPQGSIKDLKVGQTVTVNSKTDLRTLSGNEFEASLINIVPGPTTIVGNITAISGNTLKVKGNPIGTMNLGLLSVEQKDYDVSVTSNTKIESVTPLASASATTAPRRETINLSGLKQNAQVTVYAQEDVTQNSKITAARIETITPP